MLVPLEQYTFRVEFLPKTWKTLFSRNFIQIVSIEKINYFYRKFCCIQFSIVVALSHPLFEVFQDSKDLKSHIQTSEVHPVTVGNHRNYTYFLAFFLGLAVTYFLANGDWSITLFTDSSPDLSRLKDNPDWWLEDESNLLEIINSQKCNIEIKNPHELSLHLLNGTYRIDRPLIIRCV